MYSQSTSHCKQNRQHRPLMQKSEVRIKINCPVFLSTVLIQHNFTFLSLCDRTGISGIHTGN